MIHKKTQPLQHILYLLPQTITGALEVTEGTHANQRLHNLLDHVFQELKNDVYATSPKNGLFILVPPGSFTAAQDQLTALIHPRAYRYDQKWEVIQFLKNDPDLSPEDWWASVTQFGILYWKKWTVAMIEVETLITPHSFTSKILPALLDFTGLHDCLPNQPIPPHIKLHPLKKEPWLTNLKRRFSQLVLSSFFSRVMWAHKYIPSPPPSIGYAMQHLIPRPAQSLCNLADGPLIPPPSNNRHKRVRTNIFSIGR